MRTVAVLLALASALALIPPATAENECATDLVEGRLCMELPVQNPGAPPGLPGVPPQANPYFGTYYLWVGIEDCSQSPISNDCRGVPVSPGSGVPTPDGSAVGLGIFSMLYEESNNVAGLQRNVFFAGGLRQPDHTVLV